MKGKLALVSDPMPPVGGYSLDLYCRYINPDHPFQEVASFYGHTFADCAKDARAKGWVFHRNNTVTCPICHKVMR